MSWAAAAGAAIGGLAGVGSSAASVQAIKKQIQWEREKANKAHQYEVNDLKAAGLNPVLSAQGSGAQMGSISTPVPDFSGAANAINSAINIARQEKVDKANIDNTDADTALKQQETINKGVEKGAIEASTAKTMSELNLLRQQMNKIQSDIQLQTAQIEGIRSNNSLNEKQKDRIISEINKNKIENKRTLKQIEKENWNMRNNIGTSIPSGITSLIKGGVKGTMATSDYWINKLKNRKPISAKQLNKYKGGIK